MNYAIDASEDCRTMLPKLHIEVVFTSAYIDTTGGSAYGGHMEIFDVSDALLAWKQLEPVNIDP